MANPKKTNKMIVAIHLITSGVSVDEILDSTVSNLDAEGFVFGNKKIPVKGEVFTALAKYVQSLPDGKLLFPGKDGRQSNANFLVSLQGYLKEQGKTLADIGIASAYAPRTVVNFDSVESIRSYLEAKLQKPAEPEKPKKEPKTA